MSSSSVHFDDDVFTGMFMNKSTNERIYEILHDSDCFLLETLLTQTIHLIQETSNDEIGISNRL